MKACSIKQRLIKNLRIHDNIIELFIYDFTINNDKKLPIVLLNVLNKCFTFLNLFCQNNNLNKSLLKNNFKYYLHHLKKNKSIDCFKFLNEFFKNNLEILKDREKVIFSKLKFSLF